MISYYVRNCMLCDAFCDEEKCWLHTISSFNIWILLGGWGIVVFPHPTHGYGRRWCSAVWTERMQLHCLPEWWNMSVCGCVHIPVSVPLGTEWRQMWTRSDFFFNFCLSLSLSRFFTLPSPTLFSLSVYYLSCVTELLKKNCFWEIFWRWNYLILWVKNRW